MTEQELADDIVEAFIRKCERLWPGVTVRRPIKHPPLSRITAKDQPMTANELVAKLQTEIEAEFARPHKERNWRRIEDLRRTICKAQQWTPAKAMTDVLQGFASQHSKFLDDQE
jgi:hypothetical protein